MQPYPNKTDKELIEAIAQLKSEKEITAFLRDLLTLSEIREFATRFQVAKLLWTSNQPYLAIAKKHQASTTTVTRVAHWLFKESWQGYATALKRMFGLAKRN